MEYEPIHPRHCWVDVTGSWSSPSPGVLIARRRHPRGWQGWVIAADAYSTGDGVEPYVRQGWYDAGHIRLASEWRPGESG